MSTMFPDLLTPRLHLREIALTDAPALFTIHADAEWMRWYGVEPLTELAQAERLAEMFHNWTAAGTGYRWAIERRSDNRLIGTCGLFRWNHSWRNCVIGYEIARDSQRQGYMKEALQSVLDFGFDGMDLHRVQAETHPHNLASIGIAKKLGFRFEGVHREQALWGGQFHDLHCYSLLAPEWRNAAPKRRNG